MLTAARDLVPASYAVWQHCVVLLAPYPQLSAMLNTTCPPLSSEVGDGSRTSGNATCSAFCIASCSATHFATQHSLQRSMQRILQCNTACSASCNATEASPPCTCSALCPSAWRFPIFGCLVLWVWMRRPCHSVSSTGDMLPVLTPPTGGGGTRVCHAGRPETRLPAPAPRYWGLRPSATGAITGVRFLPPHRHLPPGGSREQSPQTSLVSAQRSPLFSAPVAGTVPGLRGASVSGPAHSQLPSPSYAVWRGRSPCTHVRQPFVVPPRTLRDLSSQVLPYHPPCEGLGCALGYSALGTTVRFCLSVQGSWSVLSLQARP